ncbi:MAG: hypothetical protein IPP71_09050 [Bacteroidetes bacterium]|nr:hypothetical protein [Bacteroidota bacterium]
MKKFLLLSFSTLFICLFARAQGDSKFKSDSSECYINISLFSEHFEQNNYNDAIELWRWVFAHCPAIAKHMYLDGATLFEKKIAEEKNPEMKLKFLDTLMLIYDQRIKYFNEEGFVLGKKGLSMYDLSPDKKETINTILKRSVEIEGPKSSTDVLFKYFQVNIELFGQKKMSKETVIDVYDDVLALFATQRTGSDSATYNKSRVGVETLFSAQISCEDLITIFSPQLKAAPMI